MARPRQIGTEILEGLRELKRGETGCITAAPSGAARTLLLVAAKHPQVLLEVV